MKFSTWNLWTLNNHQIKSIDFLLGQNIDIMCVQEMSEKTVDYLKSKKEYSFQYAIDHYVARKPLFNGIISKIKPVNSFTRLFKTKTAQPLLPRVFRWKVGGFLYNDYIINNRSIRVFTTHFTFATTPYQRLMQLQELLYHLGKKDEVNNVICGDLNSFGKKSLNLLLGPLFKFTRKDYTTNELASVAKQIKKYNLKFGIENATTYPLLRSQLDHILIPQQWSGYRARVYRKKQGSDHRLVILDTPRL
jgi:endonuclease/exonuclease/phosphatase family metal-dependent hydrolase